MRIDARPAAVPLLSASVADEHPKQSPGSQRSRRAAAILSRSVPSASALAANSPAPLRCIRSVHSLSARKAASQVDATLA